jgi:hypothetical protein
MTHLTSRLYSLIILALTGLIVMLEPDITPDDPAVVRCDAGNEGNPPPAKDAGFMLFGYPVEYKQDEPEQENKPALEDYPLPKWAAEWITKKGLK